MGFRFSFKYKFADELLISEISGLSETTEALFSFAERLIPSSKIAARELFGCRGVFFPLQTDAWNISTPESHGWAVWIGAAAWLALHFMEHYEYTGDIEFLKNRAYPFFKECAEFYEDYLFLGEDGLYVISRASPRKIGLRTGRPGFTVPQLRVGYRALRNGAEICDNSRGDIKY